MYHCITLYYYTDQHSSITSIKLCYLPDWEFDWSDNTPSMCSLTLEELLPDGEDAAAFMQRAVDYTPNTIRLCKK